MLVDFSLIGCWFWLVLSVTVLGCGECLLGFLGGFWCFEFGGLPV